MVHRTLYLAQMVRLVVGLRSYHTTLGLVLGTHGGFIRIAEKAKTCFMNASATSSLACLEASRGIEV